MGISIEQWRSKIGCFGQPNKSKPRFIVLVVHLSIGQKSGLRVAICLAAILIICGDVEQNPGPTNSLTDGTTRGSPSSVQASINTDSRRHVRIDGHYNLFKYGISFSYH